MHGNHAFVRVRLVYIASDLCPPRLLRSGILLWRFREIVGHRRLARETPNARQSSPTGYEIAPVLLHLLHAHLREEISPTTHHARNQSMVDQILDPQIRHVEISWVNT